MYEISIIDKTYSKIISDETKFYTSDTALELGFELKETEYDFEGAEIVLLNIDDRSLVTRPVTKSLDSFSYELEDDIIAHYGEWRGQLRFEQDGEIYVSSPVKFRIENDLGNERPPQLSDVQSWVSLKRYADSLTEELKQAVLSIEGVEDTFKANELERQSQFSNAEQSRQTTFETSESERDETFSTNETTRQTQELEREKAEAIRQQAENQRIEAESIREANDLKRETEIANIKDDILRYNTFKLVNFMENGDFRNGLDNWSFNSLEYGISDGGVSIYHTSPTSIRQMGYYLKDKPITGKWYAAWMLKGSVEDGIGTTGAFPHPTKFLSKNNEWEMLSDLYESVESEYSTDLRINSMRRNMDISDLPITVKWLIILPLTEIFGKGNEPSKEIMDWIISENGYFEELTLKRDDIQQYEINQLRKAVIALGGTI